MPYGRAGSLTQTVVSEFCVARGTVQVEKRLPDMASIVRIDVCSHRIRDRIDVCFRLLAALVSLLSS